MVKVYNLCRVETVMTAVLTVKSGMDPHTIRWEMEWFGGTHSGELWVVGCIILVDATLIFGEEEFT